MSGRVQRAGSPVRNQAVGFELDVNSIKNGFTQINEQDERVWSLVVAVPLLKPAFAWVCLTLNVLFPGIGTMVASCLGDANINKTQLIIGFT